MELQKKCFIEPGESCLIDWKLHYRVVEKGDRGQGRRQHSLPFPPFPGAKFLFHVKSENRKFLHVKNIWNLSLFVEQDISDKK